MKEHGFGHGIGMLVRGLAVGAVGMYLLDPDKGRRRRAIARDKLRRFGNDAARLTQQATRDLGNRLHGMNAAIEQRRSPREIADELKVIERVRAALGRCVAHPHAVQVGAQRGTVVLSGPILASEVPGLLSAVHGVPGVTEVENHLDMHASDEGVPSLQGARRRGQRVSPIDTPPARFLTLVGGGVLATYGLAKRGVGGLALLSAGVGLAMRAVDQDAAKAAARSVASGSSSGRDARRLRPATNEVGANAASAAPGVGADGTPLGPGGTGERSSGTQVAAGADGTPLIGNDGTRSTSADPRRSSGPSNDDPPDLPQGAAPVRTSDRPPL